MIITLIAPPAPVLAVSKACIVCSRLNLYYTPLQISTLQQLTNLWVMRGFTSTLPLATMAMAVG